MPAGRPSKIQALLNRLKKAQQELIDEAAALDGMPPASLLRRISDLENSIAAVMASLDQRSS